MAHKKAGGSSRNGRDSEAKRLALSVSVAKMFWLVASSFVNVALNSTLVPTLVAAKTTLCLLKQTVK